MDLYSPNHTKPGIKTRYPAMFAKFADNTTAVSLLYLPENEPGRSGVIVTVISDALSGMVDPIIEIRPSSATDFMAGVTDHFKLGRRPMTAYFGPYTQIAQDSLSDQAMSAFGMSHIAKLRSYEIGPAIIEGLAQHQPIKEVFQDICDFKDTRHLDQLLHHLNGYPGIRLALLRATKIDPSTQYETWGAFC